MIVWDKLKAWLTRRKGGRVAAARRVYIVDAAPLASSNGQRSRLAPRTQLNILRQLSQFARKEGIEIFAVFEGQPLHRAPDGRKFDDVVVRYAPTGQALNSLVLELLAEASRRKEVLVITADRELDAAVVSRGGTTMRVSTFKKALEKVGVSLAQVSRPRQGRRRGRRRGPAPAGPPREAESGADVVHELIDVVQTAPRPPAAESPPAAQDLQPGAGATSQNE